MKTNSIIKVIYISFTLRLSEFFKLDFMEFFDYLVRHFEEIISNLANLVIVAYKIHIISRGNDIKPFPYFISNVRMQILKVFLIHRSISELPVRIDQNIIAIFLLSIYLNTAYLFINCLYLKEVHHKVNVIVFFKFKDFFQIVKSCVNSDKTPCLFTEFLFLVLYVLTVFNSKNSFLHCVKRQLADIACNPFAI